MPNATRILAVDDREENLVALAAVLDALPVEVVSVSSGHDALRELLNDEFALILLDVVMPEMDGFETAGHIKSRARTRDIPIIFLTAAGEAGEQAFRGYAAGAVDYLTKPFDPWLLRAKVQVFVELHRQNVQLREQAALLRQSLGDEAEAPGCDRLLKAIDERVARVEHDVARLRTATAAAGGETGEGGGEGGEPLDDLEAHVGDLRLALNALAAGG
ncbi:MULTISPECIES: response regulator [Actinomadura]|uniref:Two-component system response regulator n=1 Tax=Actinomadura yumaensis TaxID=111807 RepID=A0ABW2CTN6_9ACTN|nr:response regulator [Actinomadura sp. J1-007]MWK36270.1 response regulator [Actinomadura sp. J1-007]